MPSAANVNLVGHISAPEITATSGGKPIARFSLATTRKRKEGEVTTWWSVTAWGQQAEYVRDYVQKGNLLVVTGDAYNEEYNGKMYLKVEATRVMNLTSRKAEEAPAPKMAVQAARKPIADDGDPPF